MSNKTSEKKLKKFNINMKPLKLDKMNIFEVNYNILIFYITYSLSTPYQKEIICIVALKDSRTR
jgi:hypothetical protein